MIKDIVTDVEKLQVRAEEINVQKNQDLVNEIILDLRDTLTENKLLVLTAPQIGYPYRILCMAFENDIRTFINPMVVESKDGVFSRETCPSIPGKEFIVPRFNKTIFSYQTGTGLVESNTFKEVASYLFSQATDLLDGVLISDYGLEIDEEFDKATPEEVEELLKAFNEKLEKDRLKMEEEIKKDPEAKKMADAIEFMKKVATGEIKLDRPQPKMNRATRRALEKIKKSRK